MNYKLEITGIPFNYKSFRTENKQTLSQCECVVFPDVSDHNSWILFLELKYSDNENNNENNFNKAIYQLFRTLCYYKADEIFHKTNTCYLIISMPLQLEPFINVSLDPPYLLSMKEKHNIVIRAQNSITIIDDKKIKVIIP